PFRIAEWRKNRQPKVRVIRVISTLSLCSPVTPKNLNNTSSHRISGCHPEVRRLHPRPVFWACRLFASVFDIWIREMNSRFSMLRSTDMKVVRFVKLFVFSPLVALLFLNLSSSLALAQDHDH